MLFNPKLFALLALFSTIAVHAQDDGPTDGVTVTDDEPSATGPGDTPDPTGTPVDNPPFSTCIVDCIAPAAEGNGCEL